MMGTEGCKAGNGNEETGSAEVAASQGAGSQGSLAELGLGRQDFGIPCAHPRPQRVPEQRVPELHPSSFDDRPQRCRHAP